MLLPTTLSSEMNWRLSLGRAQAFALLGKLLRHKERHVSKAKQHCLPAWRPQNNRQQPWGITPGVAAAPVAFAGGIMAGLARFIETLSLHAAEFGVGMTVIAG